MIKGMLAALIVLIAAPCYAQTVEYIHTDALGSPVVVTDQNRNIVERTEYEPYGRVLTPANPQDGPGYTGHVLDSATGLNYMQQRYYDPAIGRFLSVDPVAADVNSGDNFNRYWYANNNPYKFTDPDGRLGQLVIPTIVIGGGFCARNSSCRTAVKFAVATAAGYIGSRLLSQPEAPAPAPAPGSESGNEGSSAEEKPRFIAQPDGQVVDTEATPAGSYDQPDGGRTDILQGEDHGAGRTHTHDPVVNTNPKTGESFVNGRERTGRQVSEQDVKNIQSGDAPRSKPTGRSR